MTKKSVMWILINCLRIRIHKFEESVATFLGFRLEKYNFLRKKNFVCHFTTLDGGSLLPGHIVSFEYFQRLSVIFTTSFDIFFASFRNPLAFFISVYPY